MAKSYIQANFKPIVSSTKHRLLGLRPGRPVYTVSQERDYCLGSLRKRESGDKKDKPRSPTFPFLQDTQAE